MNGLEKVWLLLPKFSRDVDFFLPFWSDFFLSIVLMHKIISGSCDQNSIPVLRKGKNGGGKQPFFFFFFQFYIKKKKVTVV